MKRTLLLAVLLLFSVSGFAGVNYNNFTGYSDYWHPFGFPDTSTYGETFTSPGSPNTNLTSFSFYMGSQITPGTIITGAYIATWTGTQAGTLLYSAGPISDPNVGDSEITVNTGGLSLNPNANYVMFLSISNFYGQSVGQSYISQGAATIPGGGFVYFNNEGNFAELFTSSWNGPLTPDWAVNLDFSSGGTTPEPGTLALLGTGLIGAVGVMRRKFNK